MFCVQSYLEIKGKPPDVMLYHPVIAADRVMDKTMDGKNIQ